MQDWNRKILILGLFCQRTSLEAVHGLVGTETTLIGDVELQGQQILEAVLAEDRVHAEEAAVASAQGTGEMLANAVDGVSVDDTGEGVVLRPGTQSAAGSDGDEASHKVLALDVEVAVEVVVAGDLDLQTVGVLQVGRAVAALFRLVTVKRI